MSSTYVAFDLETTGFSPSVNEIIELGAVMVVNGRITGSFHSYVKPVRYIPMQITKLTGITNETVDAAPTVCEVLDEFYHWSEGFIFVGHNISFDYRFICKYGAEEAMVDFSDKGRRQGIDTLSLARKYLGLSSNRLADVAEACHLPSGTAHSAQSDAMVAHFIYQWFRVHYSEEHDVVYPTYLEKRGSDVGKAVDNGTLELW